MTRSFGFVLACALVPILTAVSAAQQLERLGDEAVDQLGKDIVRVSNAYADELEFLAKNPAEATDERKEKARKLDEKLKKLHAAEENLPRDSQEDLLTKYKKDIDLAKERIKRS